ncbi:hypothetical protein U9M48_035176, partial [Paspalum notatum var. saurae]
MEGLRIKRSSATASSVVGDCVKCVVGIAHKRHRKGGPKKEKRTKKPNKQQLQVVDAAGSKEKGGKRKKTTFIFSPMTCLLVKELDGYMLSEPENPFMKPDFGDVLFDPDLGEFYERASESKANVLLQYRLKGHADFQLEEEKEEVVEEKEFTQVEENMWEKNMALWWTRVDVTTASFRLTVVPEYCEVEGLVLDSSRHLDMKRRAQMILLLKHRTKREDGCCKETPRHPSLYLAKIKGDIEVEGMSLGSAVPDPARRLQGRSWVTVRLSQDPYTEDLV